VRFFVDDAKDISVGWQRGPASFDTFPLLSSGGEGRGDEESGGGGGCVPFRGCNKYQKKQMRQHRDRNHSKKIVPFIKHAYNVQPRYKHAYSVLVQNQRHFYFILKKKIKKNFIE
jgi:hypothetical protein